MKLAFFVDQIFWHDGERYSSDEAYTLFPVSFRSAFDEVVLIGRLAPEPGRKPYVLPTPGVTLCPLPYYRTLYEAWQKGPQLWQQVRQRVEAQLPTWDVLVVCGPHPIGQAIAGLCIKRGLPTALVVRQNLVAQMRFANRGVKQAISVGVALWLEWRFRQLARGRTVFAVGQEMTDAYAAIPARAHAHFASLITDEQLAALSAVVPAPEPDQLLFVGRLSAEKGVQYLLQALIGLKAAGRRYTLAVVGTGSFEATLRTQVNALGLEEQVTFYGYIAFGEALLQLYQKAMALVVPSLQGEGFPQVINEALAVGVPVIASRVGGIPAFLSHEESGLLVPSANVAALVNAIQQISDSPALRQRLRQQGQALMQANTLEANRDRIIKIIETEVLHASIRPHSLRSG